MALETTTELRNFLAEEVGDSQPSAAEQTRLLRLLDSAHKEIVGGGGLLNVDNLGRPNSRPFIFPWALTQSPIVVTTSAPVETGTVAITSATTALTFSSAPSASLAGWYIKINNKSTIYRITAHTAAAAAATLDSAYVDATETAATFVAFKLDYTFGDSTYKMQVPVDYIRSYEGFEKISLVGYKELLDQYPLRDRGIGDPRIAGVRSLADGQLVVQFSHYPSSARKIELQYVAVPTELTTGGVDPILPKDDRKVLVHLAAYYQLIYRDDSRAQQHLDIARRLFKSMKAKAGAFSEHNDSAFGVIRPFPGGFGRKRKGLGRGDYRP